MRYIVKEGDVATYRVRAKLCELAGCPGQNTDGLDRAGPSTRAIHASTRGHGRGPCDGNPANNTSAIMRPACVCRFPATYMSGIDISDGRRRGNVAGKHLPASRTRRPHPPDPEARSPDSSRDVVPNGNLKSSHLLLRRSHVVQGNFQRASRLLDDGSEFLIR